MIWFESRERRPQLSWENVHGCMDGVLFKPEESRKPEARRSCTFIW
jgi:hypothetical protein